MEKFFTLHKGKAVCCVYHQDGKFSIADSKTVKAGLSCDEVTAIVHSLVEQGWAY